MNTNEIKIEVLDENMGFGINLEVEADCNLECCSNNILHFEHLSHGVYRVTSAVKFDQNSHDDLVRLRILETMPPVKTIKCDSVTHRPVGYFWEL